MKLGEKYTIFLRFPGPMLRQHINESSCDTSGPCKGAEGIQWEEKALSDGVSQWKLHEGNPGWGPCECSLSWLGRTLPVSHRSQAPFLVARASPRFKNSALHHQGSDVEGGTLWRQPTGDSNGFGLLVLLHTLNNPKASMIYLFPKTCHMQLLLAPGRLVVGGQADQVRTVIGEER